MLGDVVFAHASMIHLLWPVLGAIALLAWLELRGGEVLGRFVSAVMQRRLSWRPSLGQRLARLALMLGCLVLAVLALMQPQIPGRTETVTSSEVSADIMVVLDVSRSMLADDVAPTRLARAKAEVAELSSALRGHRIGLVAFAGRASVLAPLTPDYGFFRMILDGVDTKSVSRGGTEIGQALRKAVRSFDPGPGAKMILLITDGEDHGGYAEDAAREALEAGVRVVAIGFGSEQGSQITLVDPDTGARALLTDGDGAPVVSRLDGELLRSLALTTEGVYVPAGVSAIDLETIVSQHIEPLMAAADDRSIVRKQPRQLYPWFVLGSLLGLLGAVLLGASAGRRQAL
ncbi:VWA domain-containing protein [Haliangium ochraceum]|uniref:von Willebrand factor type A n=1 Tax=Haliangium ochraceum (strain DSM 14365 / JCM 11303 / SMP-2) TaxID=502025 RepID=D0LKC8_HALO1|nr:VWA domain-containing protein [Haliangium ochraceum]ACY13162.1 von Willebrand factor type A [Haliangium ochraceum DSM 14365]